MSNQPVWKCVGRVGDVNPIDHGGGFIYIDETGVYPPEVEYIEEPFDDGDGDEWTVFRFVLEPCFWTDISDEEDGSYMVLSDNRFHKRSPAWFAKPEQERQSRPQDTTYLKDLADSVSMEVQELVDLFISDDPQKRAAAWLIVAGYHGFEELDHYPLKIKGRDAILKRYAEELSNKPTTKGNK